MVRAYRPEAVRVDLLPDGGGRIPMRPRGSGLFEARAEGRSEVFPYLLEVEYQGGAVYGLRDPYAFPPTLGELDLYFAGEGRHEQLWRRLGAHPIHHQGVMGVSFAVWAPTAASVSVVGDFNGWDGRLHPMRAMGASGIWELFVPEVGEGARYKFEVHPAHGGPRLLKADPFAFRTEVPPQTASVVHDLGRYRWGDGDWLAARERADLRRGPMSVYEAHLGSFRRVMEDGNRPLTYREAAEALGDYAFRMGFTHVELLPVAEHPFGGSWGYQVSAYYAPTARYGHPDDFRFLVDALHRRGVGVIVDWVPGHFPRDDFALSRFDGTALYEHEDPRQGAHPDWGTLIFNYGRHEVRNFLIANALFWIEEYHLDGLRVDAVASMLYRDYSRAPGEWVPNRYGGRENEEAVAFLRELNEVLRRKHPAVVTIAEESTAWPKVSRPASEGGLGFTFKWNMGWMHDTLAYFGKDPLFRRWLHHQLTFGLMYAFSEEFVLPLSHDEVVHGKRSLLSKMPGDEWQRLANLRALFGWMWAHPGKKHLFMGGELGQLDEWSPDRSVDWHLLERRSHHGVQALVRDLNRLYRAEPALHQTDSEASGFQWVQADSADANVYAFLRSFGGRQLLCVANLSPLVRHRYRVGAPASGLYREVLNTDASEYGGSGVGNLGSVHAAPLAWDGQPASLELSLPPLGVLWLRPETG
ncbi:MAG: 1,4-alpha-glucan branching protein GlgB [Myxococcales bacterium]|nr:1,4-alpha-glucan branching protein GlgB [Myxococcales bacterium]